MSFEEDDEDRGRFAPPDEPAFVVLAARTDEEIGDSGKPVPVCDHCGEEQFFGNFARVCIAWDYKSLCRTCALALARTVVDSRQVRALLELDGRRPG